MNPISTVISQSDSYNLGVLESESINEKLEYNLDRLGYSYVRSIEDFTVKYFIMCPWGFNFETFVQDLSNLSDLHGVELVFVRNHVTGKISVYPNIDYNNDAFRAVYHETSLDSTTPVSEISDFREKLFGERY